jgi:DNA-binding beta-propeller fold protein YncE
MIVLEWLLAAVIDRSGKIMAQAGNKIPTEGRVRRRCAVPRAISVLLLVGLTGFAGCAAPRTSQIAPPATLAPLFTLVGDFSLGAATSRVDYQSVDATARRLYIAKMGAGQVLVFDLDSNHRIATLDGFPKATGILVVPDLHKVYVSVPGAGILSSISVALGMLGLSPGSGKIAILDTRTLRETARIPGGVFPDGIAYDPKDRRIFVSDELGSAVLVIDAGTDRLVGEIEPGGEVGNVQYDPITAKIYAPLQSRNELAVVDPVTLQVVARRALPGADHPHGLAIAPSAAVGYVACDGNDRLLTVDLVTGKVIASRPVAHDPDVLAVDPPARRLYVASESGKLSTFDISSPAAPASLGDVFVGRDAHSVAVDPASHRLYLPLANVQGRSVLRVLVPKS